MGLPLNKKKMFLVYILFLIISLVTFAYAINEISVNNKSDNLSIKPDIGIKPMPIIEPIDETILPDIILTNFNIDKRESFVNESTSGYFDVEILNLNNLSFNAYLIINNADYLKQQFEISNSGRYDLQTINFSEPGNYTLTLFLDPENSIEESNEDNNIISLNITIIENMTIPGSYTNETLPIINETNSNLPIINQTNTPNPLINETNFTDIITGDVILDNINETPLVNTPLVEIPSQRSYIYFNNQLLETIDSDSNTNTYYHQDLQNNIVLVTDDNGQVIQTNEYEPFGREISYNDNIYNSKKFSTKEKDDSGLIYFGARYYDENSGRFISTDPSFNPSESSYAYAGNNPLKFTDPDGRAKQSVNKEFINNPPRNDDGARESKRYLYQSLSDFSTKFKQANPNQLNLKADRVGGAIGLIGVANDIYEPFRDAYDKNYDPRAWNNFWAKYIPAAETVIIFDSHSRWTDPITGVQMIGTDMPYRYNINDRDITYAMENVNTEKDFDTFFNLMNVQRDKKTKHLVFKTISNKPISSEMEKLYYKMDTRAHIPELKNNAK